MKKTLIALAAVAATAGVAHAQSSVTLYGVADAWFGTTSTETTGAAPVARLSQTVINGSGVNSSRWGLRGSEDLGGGMSAVFTLESGFAIDSGAFANNGGSTVAASTSVLFGRAATVGLKGSFGEVRVGRQLTAYDTLRGATNHSGDANVWAVTGPVWSTGIQDYSNRTNNSIRYDSPSFGGISGSVVYGFGEDKTATTSASNSASLHIKYANGPLLVGYAYQREKAPVGSTQFSGAALNGSTLAIAATVAEDSRKYNLFGASYDFGVVKLVGAYNTAKNNTLKDKEYELGVSAPFGPTTVYAGYARAKSEGTGANNKGKGLSLMATYDLSKRTMFYAGYRNTKIETTNGTNTVKGNQYGAGIRHSF